MSKKDYQTIAAAVFTSGLYLPDGAGVQAVLHAVAANLADKLAADNPRFSRERFIEACETGRCRGMRQVLPIPSRSDDPATAVRSALDGLE